MKEIRIGYNLNFRIPINYYNWSDDPNNRIPESIPLMIPDPGKAVYVHRETEEGMHIYGSYGVNWFGRSQESEVTHRLKTLFRPQNRLLAPSSIQALHIVEERPLLLTSLHEQELYNENPNSDKTLVRLLFDYHSTHELVNYKITEEDKIKFPDLFHPEAIFEDSREVFANSLELFFRNEVPKNIIGQVKNIQDHPTDELFSIIETQAYTRHSTGEQIIPQIPSGTTATNFVGGIWASNNDRFVIHSINQNTSGTIFITVYKNQSITSENALVAPTTTEGDGFFMAIENMLSPSSWGANNPHTFTISIPDWPIKRELVVQEGLNGDIEETLEKSRGIWDDNCTINEVLEPETVNDQNEVLTETHKGVYKIQLSQTLAQHPQFANNQNSVEWYGGVVRIHSVNEPNGARRVLKVIRIEHIGSTTENVVLYVQDDTFQLNDNNQYVSDNPIITEGAVSINFYPGYKVYLYTDQNWGLTADNLAPKDDEEVGYSIFGLRSVDTDHSHADGTIYRSPIGVPGMMFTQKIIDPKRPELPSGALYTTRPDSFGKATYTLNTKFKHNPYAILYYRTDEQAILNALYSAETQKNIKIQLQSLGKDVYQNSRWNNLLGFDYTYGENDPVNENGQFGVYPPTAEGYRFPNPDSSALFEAINKDIVKFNKEFDQNIENKMPGQLLPSDVILPGSTDGENTILTDYIQRALFEIFSPLTEVPLLYAHIKPDGIPVNKKQVIRDRNGYLLKPSDDLYEIAPMARKDTAKKEVLFTDFTLDGTSNNLYFYRVKEMGSTMQMGEFSPILGPITLVNTKPPLAPEIKRVLPKLATRNFEMKKISLSFTDQSNIEINENEITKTSNNNWDAGIASQQMFKGNTYITYQVSKKANLMVGFSRMHQNDHFNTIEYGLLCRPNEQLFVYQKGSELKNIGNYTETTALKIERKGKVILFYKDQEIVYTLHTNHTLPILVDIAIRRKNSGIKNLELYTNNQYFTQETLEGTEVPLTITNFDNVAITENTITKPNGLDSWDSGGTSNEFIPYYGAISYKVTAGTNIMVGLASYNEENDFSSIDYALYTKDDGYLYTYQNGEMKSKCIGYNQDSLLTIERRNDQLVFKKDHRPFFIFQLNNNIPLLFDFALNTVGSSIRDIKMYQIQKLVQDTIPKNTSSPCLQIEINAYQNDQNISKINLYRTLEPANSLSIRTMELVQSVDLKIEGLLNENILTLTDAFLDLEYIPYSDPIFYRATVCREIEYTIEENGESKVITEYAPSEPSRVIISSIVESSNPLPPNLYYSFDTTESQDIIENVLLQLNKTVHNGKYFIYKMNTQGNWVKIHELISNEQELQLFLSDTNLNNGTLQLTNPEGNTIYHHFKVDCENSVGMLNTQSNRLTISNDQGIAKNEGVGSMIIENTNLIR